MARLASDSHIWRRYGVVSIVCAGVLGTLYLVSFLPRAPLSVGTAALFMIPLFPAFAAALFVRKGFDGVPGRHRLVFYLLLAFAVGNWFFHPEGTDPKVTATGYALTSPGKVVQEITSAEFDAAKRRTFRQAAPTVLMLLYAIGVVLAFGSTPRRDW